MKWSKTQPYHDVTLWDNCFAIYCECGQDVHCELSKTPTFATCVCGRRYLFFFTCRVLETKKENQTDD